MTFATNLSPLSSRLERTASNTFRSTPEVDRRRARPPRGFKLLRGAVTDVQFAGVTPVNRGHTAAQRMGLAYEQKVHDVLRSIYSIDYRANPSILFRDSTGARRAIPDGLLKVGSNLVLIEIKLSHTEKAWWQLRHLYLPLLQKLVVPGTRIYCVELCRTYDPSVEFPEPHRVIKSLHDVSDTVGVLQWRI